MIHARILAALQAELTNKYVLSSTIRHKGERGRQRDSGVAGFLRENLPSAYGVATGELFSFVSDSVSPQCDVIIYDSLRTPVIGRSAAVQQVPIEGTHAVVEVKSILNATALEDCGRKFDAIRRMWYSAYPRGRGKEDGPSFFVFGFRLETTAATIIKFLKSRNGQEDVQIVALDAGASIWISGKRTRPEWLDLSGAEHLDMYGTLGFFLLTLLSVCDTEFAPLDYLDIFVGG
jgi:hypothetical protein